VPIVFIYMVVLAIVAWMVLEHTPWGRRVRATGSGPDAARLAGVRTSWYVFWTLVVSGMVASLAGVLFIGRIGIVGPSVGQSYLLPTFAACFLGTTQIRPGRFNVWGTLLALFLLATGIQGLQLAGGQLWISDMFNGVALVAAVGLSVYAARRRAARQRQRTETA
jgi:ribose transport system permease protein